jgi:hypothetical protein
MGGWKSDRVDAMSSGSFNDVGLIDVTSYVLRSDVIMRYIGVTFDRGWLNGERR